MLEPTQIPEVLEYHLAGIQHLDVNGMSATEIAEEILPALQRLLGGESDEANAAVHTVRLSRRRSANVWIDWRLDAFGIMTAALVWILKPVSGLLQLNPPPTSPQLDEKEQENGNTNDVFALQSQIAQNVALALSVELGSSEIQELD